VARRGSTVTGVEPRSDGAVVLDLVVFADGITSFGRSYLHPNVSPKYAGYVVWRGLVPAGVVPAALLEHGLEVAERDGGHCVVYQVPDPELPGKSLLNWGFAHRSRRAMRIRARCLVAGLPMRTEGPSISSRGGSCGA
jgi:2-polyprenyl-6-methoxyphenol hydroxylase-like FAD-dependent oxidoreductase